jgi:hypothetical protein
VPEG